MNRYGSGDCEYVRYHYGVPACIGRRVIVDGKPGVIAEDRGSYIGILLDEDPPTAILSYHPTDGIEYLGMGKVRKLPYKKRVAKQRYAEYLEYSECYTSFAHFLKCKELERKEKKNKGAINAKTVLLD